MLTLLNKSSSSHMRLASTKQRPEEGETSLATEPFQLFLANMVETTHCHLQMHCHAKPRPYTTAHILTFLVAFHNILLPPESITEADHQRNWYVVVWDNTLSASGAAPPTMLCISEPPQKGSWCWAYERQPFVCTPLVQAVKEPCGEIDMGAIQGMDEALEAFLPSASGKGRRCLWCGRGIVGRPSCAATCCLIILLTSFFLPYIFSPNFLFHLNVFLPIVSEYSAVVKWPIKGLSCGPPQPSEQAAACHWFLH